MIKVLEKLFKALEVLRSDCDLPLVYIARRTNINKATLCNIFKTLTALGYVENDGHGNYRLSKNFMALGAPSPNKVLIEQLSMEFCTGLAGKTRESAVIATLVETKIDIIAQARYECALMVNLSIYKNLSIWRSTTGRILLAHLDEDELRGLIGKVGYPGHLWDGAKDFETVLELLKPIRENRMAIMVNTKEYFTAFSVPFFDEAGLICGCVGFTVPRFRLKGGAEEKIMQELRLCGEAITRQNIELNLTARDWRKR